MENIFFFQAEDGIRDYDVTGVQTCALPIWAVVAGENDIRVVIKAELAQFVDDTSGVVVDLLDDVAVEACLGLAFEVLRRGQQRVGHSMGHVDEEWVVLVFLDELKIGRASCRERV